MSEIPERLLPFCDYPAKALSHSARMLLSKNLNPEQDSLSSSQSLVQDWRGMAEFFGFSTLDVENFMREKSPTFELLRQWALRDGSKIGIIFSALEAIERFDILNDDQLVNSLERDCLAHQRNLQSQSNEILPGETQPIQVDEITSPDESRFITVNEADTGVPEYFDAFVCYTREDFEFVRQMMHVLETVNGLKLCIVSRDLIPGSAKYVVMAKLIQERCRKMIIVLSPDYINSKECDFQTRFAHSLSPGAKEKKLIPVMYRQCEIPPILNYICTVDYTRCDVVEWFWVRLANSLKNPPRGHTGLFTSSQPWSTGTTTTTTFHQHPVRESAESGPPGYVIASSTSGASKLDRTSSDSSLIDAGSYTSWTDLSSPGICLPLEIREVEELYVKVQNRATGHDAKPTRRTKETTFKTIFSKFKKSK